MPGGSKSARQHDHVQEYVHILLILPTCVDLDQVLQQAKTVKVYAVFMVLLLQHLKLLILLNSPSTQIFFASCYHSWMFELHFTEWVMLYEFDTSFPICLLKVESYSVLNENSFLKRPAYERHLGHHK